MSVRIRMDSSEIAESPAIDRKDLGGPRPQSEDTDERAFENFRNALVDRCGINDEAIARQLFARKQLRAERRAMREAERAEAGPQAQRTRATAENQREAAAGHRAEMQRTTGALGSVNVSTQKTKEQEQRIASGQVIDLPTPQAAPIEPRAAAELAQIMAAPFVDQRTGRGLLQAISEQLQKQTNIKPRTSDRAMASARSVFFARPGATPAATAGQAVPTGALPSSAQGARAPHATVAQPNPSQAKSGATSGSATNKTPYGQGNSGGLPGSTGSSAFGGFGEVNLGWFFIFMANHIMAMQRSRRDKKVARNNNSLARLAGIVAGRTLTKARYEVSVAETKSDTQMSSQREFRESWGQDFQQTIAGDFDQRGGFLNYEVLEASSVLSHAGALNSYLSARSEMEGLAEDIAKDPRLFGSQGREQGGRLPSDAPHGLLTDEQLSAIRRSDPIKAKQYEEALDGQQLRAGFASVAGQYKYAINLLQAEARDFSQRAADAEKRATTQKTQGDHDAAKRLQSEASTYAKASAQRLEHAKQFESKLQQARERVDTFSAWCVDRERVLAHIRDRRDYSSRYRDLERQIQRHAADPNKKDLVQRAKAFQRELLCRGEGMNRSFENIFRRSAFGDDHRLEAYVLRGPEEGKPRIWRQGPKGDQPGDITNVDAHTLAVTDLPDGKDGMGMKSYRSRRDEAAEAVVKAVRDPSNAQWKDAPYSEAAYRVQKARDDFLTAQARFEEHNRIFDLGLDTSVPRNLLEGRTGADLAIGESADLRIKGEKGAWDSSMLDTAAATESEVTARGLGKLEAGDNAVSYCYRDPQMARWMTWERLGDKFKDEFNRNIRDTEGYADRAVGDAEGLAAANRGGDSQDLGRIAGQANGLLARLIEQSNRAYQQGGAR